MSFEFTCTIPRLPPSPPPNKKNEYNSPTRSADQPGEGTHFNVCI